MTEQQHTSRNMNNDALVQRVLDSLERVEQQERTVLVQVNRIEVNVTGLKEEFASFKADELKKLWTLVEKHENYLNVQKGMFFIIIPLTSFLTSLFTAWLQKQ